MSGGVRFLLSLAVMIILCVGQAAFAIEPGERLDDPVLEARARSISQDLRCLVCQNVSIDESNASLAKDLRLLVRERLLAGDSDADVKQFMVDRYGDFVLLKPRITLATIGLWLVAPVAGLIGLLVLLVRRRSGPSQATKPLSADEEQRLKALMNRPDLRMDPQ